MTFVQRQPAAPARSDLRRRTCACGAAGATGTCAACETSRGGALQRAETNSASLSTVPPIVHEVLASPGQPLDVTTRSFMEPRFGHDFSRVRVHADARASESARVVSALAYTVGRDVVFGAGRILSESQTGRYLLA